MRKSAPLRSFIHYKSAQQRFQRVSRINTKVPAAMLLYQIAGIQELRQFKVRTSLFYLTRITLILPGKIKILRE